MSDRGDSLEFLCLKALKVDADSERMALCAASIVVHAYAAARAAPGARAEALRIVELARQLYAERPTRASLGALVDETLAEAVAVGPGWRARARDRIVERVFQHLQRGNRARPG